MCRILALKIFTRYFLRKRKKRCLWVAGDQARCPARVHIRRVPPLPHSHSPLWRHTAFRHTASAAAPASTLQEHSWTLSSHYCTSISPPLLLHGQHKLQHSLPSLHSLHSFPSVHTDPDRRIISDSATSTHNQNLKHARPDYLYQRISISFVFLSILSWN